MTAVAVCALSAGTVIAESPVPDPVSVSASTWLAITQLIREWSLSAGALATTMAVVAGGIFALRNAQIFRAKSPHVTVSHNVSHRPVGNSYMHIFVTVILHNSSRVHIEFLDGFATIRQIRPVSDEDVEYLYRQVFVDQVFDNLQWPPLDTTRLRWPRDGLLVEPGETETEIFDFVVQRDVQSVAITTYFYNSRVVGNIPDGIKLDAVARTKKRFRRWNTVRGPLGSGRTSVYDIVSAQ